MDETEITKQSYDRIAKEYAERTFVWPSIDQLKHKFVKYVKRGKVLDVGCGPGRDVKYFMENGLDVSGIDYSDEMIKEAKRRVPQGNFKKMDMRKLEFANNSFDGIWSCSSILHIPKSEVENLIKEFARVLKPNGILLITTKRGSDETVSLEDHNVPRFMASYEKEELEVLVEKSKFNILESSANEKYVVVIAQVKK